MRREKRTALLPYFAAFVMAETDGGDASGLRASLCSKGAFACARVRMGRYSEFGSTGAEPPDIFQEFFGQT
jgi:hypothetical protein